MSVAGELDELDLVHRVAVVLASGGPVADEIDAAEEVVAMLRRDGFLPADIV